jgi:hypothetical protein
MEELPIQDNGCIRNNIMIARNFLFVFPANPGSVSGAGAEND